MTISFTCDPEKLKARKARLVKDHEKLDAQIHSLASTEAGRIRNDAEIKRLKREKMPLKRAIAACDEHLAKLERDAARAAREKKLAENPDLTAIEIGGKTLLIDTSPNPASYEINTEDNGEPVLGPLQRRDAAGNWVNVAA